MRLGVLDVGSNTVHLLVVDAHPGARPVPQASHKSVLRLMRYLEPDGSISELGVRSILEAIGGAVAAAREDGIEELLPFATSAIREAANGEDVLALIARETGVELRVLSGDDEARNTFLAVRRWYGWSTGRILLFDIGGGSLEIAQGADEDPEIALSVPLGAGRSTVEFLPHDPPTDGEVRRLRAHAREVLAEVVREFPMKPRADHVVGSSKTIRSLARLAGTTGDGPGASDRAVLTLKGLDDWTPLLARIPADAGPRCPASRSTGRFRSSPAPSC